jgi:hypothetical protein
MDELIQSIAAAVSAAPDGLVYKTLHANTAPEKRPMLPNALKTLKARNELHEQVRVVDGVVLHTLHVGPNPNPIQV